MNLSVIPFLVDYEAIMEERKRIADEEERKRKEHELKVTMNPTFGFEYFRCFNFQHSDLQCHCYSSLLSIIQGSKNASSKGKESQKRRQEEKRLIFINANHSNF